jgi:probable F420-dependent oxidoreductase
MLAAGGRNAMDFGVNTLTRGATADRAGYLAVARKAEALGYGYIGVNDHVVVPQDIASRYPYTEEGNWPGKVFGECLDALGMLCFLAGCTERVRLLTSVMVLAHRHPVLTAKLITTADVMSAGRVIVGCGVGWMKEEVEILGGNFAARGKAADEFLDAFKVLWTEERPRYSGEHVRFDNIAFAPKPVQKPHPPLWIGGEGPVALRRVARVGDGWYPVSNNPQHPLDTPERLGKGIEALKQAAKAIGRDPATIDLALVHLGPLSPAERKGPDARRLAFTGKPADVAADVDALARLGIKHLSLTFQGGSLGETLERMDRFAADVMPLVRR